MIALNLPTSPSIPELARRPRVRRARSPWPVTFAVMAPLALIIAGMACFDIRAAGVVYALSIILFSFLFPQLALMLAFALAPFVQELPIPGPVKISIGELTLALCLPAFLITSLPRIRVPIFVWCSFLYIGACVLTTLINRDKEAVAPLFQIGLYLVVTVVMFASFLRDPAKFRFILDGSLAVTTLLALLTYTPAAAALDINKNSLGASMAAGLLIAVESWFASHKSKRRRWILTAVMVLLSATLLLSLSRGSWLAAVAGLLVIVSLRRQFKLLLKLAVLLIPLCAILFTALPEEKQQYALSLDPSRDNIEARINTIDDAKAAFFQHPLYGGGISYRKNIDATNLVFVSLAESGILGLSTFALVHLALFGSIWRTQKKIPRSHVLYSPVALGAALVTAHLAHGMVDHYWSRGPLLQAWAAAGMAAAVAATLRARSRRLQNHPIAWPANPEEMALHHSAFQMTRDPAAP